MSNEVPEGWRLAKLGEIAALSGGTTPPKSNDAYWTQGEVPWATPSDITSLPLGQTHIADTEAHVAKLALEECSLKLNPTGTVLMTSRATIGYAVINDVPMATNQGFLNFTCSDDCDPRFLCHWLNANRGLLTAAAGGSTFKELSRGTAKLLPIPLPTRDEQRRIAEVLRSVDEAANNAQICLSNAQSVMSALLDHHFITNADVEGSSSALLSTLIDLQSGYAFKSDEYQESGHFLIRIGNVQDGYISDGNPKFVGLDAKSKGFELHAGDILTSLTGNIGRVARVDSAHLPAALNQRVARIKPKPNVAIDADYLFFALKSPLFKAGLSRASGGAAQQNVSPKAIASIAIPLPSIEHQSLIGAALLSVDKLTFAADDALKRLEDLKSVVRSDLLSGRVRVPA